MSVTLYIIIFLSSERDVGVKVLHSQFLLIGYKVWCAALSSATQHAMPSVEQKVENVWVVPHWCFIDTVLSLGSQIPSICPATYRIQRKANKHCIKSLYKIFVIMAVR